MIKTIAVVGGGSAGWMTASYLTRALPNVEITVVESERIRTIGVGEATFSTFKLFFDYLGLEERDWMPHCSASYKLAIRFENWTKTNGHFYHPFQRFDIVDGVSAGEWWLKLKRKEEAFDYACFTSPALCDAKRSPKFLDGMVFDDKVRDFFTEDKPPQNFLLSKHKVQYPYGYHFNAAELALFLQKYAVERRAKRIVDDIVEVPLREDGAIAALRTKEHGLITADIYIDCTGFRGLLINEALGEPFISFNNTLLNDSAVAIQVPRDIEKEGIKPYTSASAFNAGWSWNIPLYGRDGTGYVYSSKFITQHEAERELRDFLGPAADGCTANHIKMRIGRSRNSWVKNCVAIGLSSGFVEPLESTGIFFIQHGIEELIEHFPSAMPSDENTVMSYNRVVAECIDGVRQFLAVHYCMSDRDDTPYWKATKNIFMPDPLRDLTQIWKTRLPGPRSIYAGYHGFESYSWAVVLMGMSGYPSASLPILDHRGTSRARAMFMEIKQRSKKLVEALPSHYEYLSHMRKTV